MMKKEMTQIAKNDLKRNQHVIGNQKMVQLNLSYRQPHTFLPTCLSEHEGRLGIRRMQVDKRRQ
jgi:hypothetical protein